MLFTINDLGFSIAGLLLEGWLAFAARCVCALALLFIGWVVSRWLQKSLFPRLLKRSWHFAFTHPLLESFARPTARIAWYTGMYLALASTTLPASRLCCWPRPAKKSAPTAPCSPCWIKSTK